MSNKEIFTLIVGGGVLMGLGYWISRIEKRIPKRVHEKPKVTSVSNIIPKKKTYILLLGDSITEYSGWGGSLANIYRHRADVLNRGFSGYNSRFLLESVKLLYPENSKDLPILTILMCGTNDSSIECNKIQHIDIDEFENNMKEIIEYLLKLKSNMKIIVLTPTPVDDITYKNYCASMNEEQLRSNDVMSVYSEKVMKLRNKISNNKNVYMIDLFNGMQQNENWESYLRDGVHPSSKGNEYIYKEIISAIKTKFPLLDPENVNGLQPYFPHWKTFAYENVCEFLKRYHQNYLGELKILE